MKVYIPDSPICNKQTKDFFKPSFNPSSWNFLRFHFIMAYAEGFFFSSCSIIFQWDMVGDYVPIAPMSLAHPINRYLLKNYQKAQVLRACSEMMQKSIL